MHDLLTRAKARASLKAGSFAWDPHDQSLPPARVEPPAGRRPLRVVLANEGRSCVAALADPRIELVAASAEAWESFDVLVVARADRLQLADLDRAAPAAAWDRIASGRAVLVLDGSGEGTPHQAELSEALHGLLRAKGAAPHQAAYITQDRAYRADYAEHCRRLGLGDRGLRIWVYDLYVQRIFTGPEGTGEAVFEERLALHRARPPRRERRFISLNNAVRPAKAMFLLQLLEDGLWTQGYISVGRVRELKGGKVMTVGQYLKRLAALPGFEDLGRRLAGRVEELEGLSPIRLGHAASGAGSEKALRQAMLDVEAMPEYQQSWFTVVTESHVTDRLHRITEKPFKALLNFHPIIVLGALGSLRLIRSYGFETYPQLFDETYDEEPRLRGRFDQVHRQVAALCRMDEAELARRVGAVEETAIFNAWWGLVELPKLFRSRIDPRLADLMIGMFLEEAGSSPACG